MLNQLQRLGKVLIFPICVLPFAALLNRIGAIGTDTTLFAENSIGHWIGFIINAPGGAVFNTTNLSLIFAVGVAFGFSKDNRGEAALVGALGFVILQAFLAEKGIAWLMYNNVDKTLVDSDGNIFSKLLYVLKTKDNVSTANYQLDTGVFGGITIGILAAFLYNKFRDIMLPQYLAFFGGRRFIPMVMIIAMFPLAFLFAAIWPWCQYGLQGLGSWIGGTKEAAPAAGVLYGVANRLLQPFGLHHIINIFLWFQLPVHGKLLSDIANNGGSYDNAPWTTEYGDITAFAKGLVGSGLWQTGFFPMFLGGLPGAAIAMWYCAKHSKRKETFVFLAGVAFVAFLTGIDEPLAFAFIFAAPLLWIVHAIFTGIICGLTLSMGIRTGFGFSAGFIDYAISFWRSWQFSRYAHSFSWAPSWLANPLWIFPLSIGSFGAYFFSFTVLIKKFNILTPGRTEDDPVSSEEKIINEIRDSNQLTKKDKAIAKYHFLASEIIDSIGSENIIEVSNCTTRLRFKLKDNSNIDEKRIKSAGAYNIIKLGKNATQIVIGNDVEHVTNQIQAQLKNI